MKLEDIFEGAQEFGVYYSFDEAGSPPRVVAGPFASEAEAEKWMGKNVADDEKEHHSVRVMSAKDRKRAQRLSEEEKVWDKPTPKGKETGKLTSAQKAKAKARAKREGRPYPNRIDNMWAAQQ
jgi:hypothetical protein